MTALLRLRRPRVLIADADMQFCGDACGYLNAYGCETRGVSESAQFLLIARHWHPEIVFLNTALSEQSVKSPPQFRVVLPEDSPLLILISDIDIGLRSYNVPGMHNIASLKKPFPISDLLFFI
jgi:hypothetical protein